MHVDTAAISFISDTENVRADCEDRVYEDDAENADHDGARCGAADVRRAAARLQADVAADDRDQRAEAETLETADGEVVRAQRAACLLEVRRGSHVEHADGDHEP